MRRIILIIALFLLAAAGPAAAAELTILQPADHSVLRGTIEFRIKAEHAPGETIIGNPMITLQDEVGTSLETVRTLRDPKTGICSTSMDTKLFKDGLYYVSIAYRSIMGGTVQDTEKDLVLGIRNGPAHPSRVRVELENRDYPIRESCAVTVTVLDQRGRPMPAARISLKAEGGALDQDTRITDGSGEATVSVDTEQPGNVILTITVEKLPPVRRVIRFVQ